jgi:hypothetical protein
MPKITAVRPSVKPASARPAPCSPVRLIWLRAMWPHTIAGMVASGPNANCASPQARLAVASLGDHGIARLPHLGHAFGTKFLYFCSATSSQPALILDRLVARWLRENAGLPLTELQWSLSTYVRYLEIMFGWADELALAADELELRIFSAQAGGLGDSQWAPG